MALKTISKTKKDHRMKVSVLGIKYSQNWMPKLFEFTGNIPER